MGANDVHLSFSILNSSLLIFVISDFNISNMIHSIDKGPLDCLFHRIRYFVIWICLFFVLKSASIWNVVNSDILRIYLSSPKEIDQRYFYLWTLFSSFLVIFKNDDSSKSERVRWGRNADFEDSQSIEEFLWAKSGLSILSEDELTEMYLEQSFQHERL